MWKFGKQEKIVKFGENLIMVKKNWKFGIILKDIENLEKIWKFGEKFEPEKNGNLGKNMKFGIKMEIQKKIGNLKIFGHLTIFETNLDIWKKL